MNEDVIRKLMDSLAKFRRLKRGQKQTTGLKPSDMMLLMKMFEMSAAGEELSVSNLSLAMGVSKPFVTNALNGLMKEGLVERETDQTDRRMVMITVTQKGKEQMEKAKQHFMSGIRGLAEQLGEERSLLLAELLGEAYVYLEKFHRFEEQEQDQEQDLSKEGHTC